MTVHLGERAAALVDGQLDHRTREFALAHIAHCAACRTEVDAQRRLKSQVVGLGTPGLPPVLAQRLVGMGLSIAPGPAMRQPPVQARRFPSIPLAPVAALAPVTRPSPTRAPVRGTSAVPTRRSHTRHVLAGSAFVLAVGAGGAMALGGSASASHEPAVTPPVNAFVAQHADVTSLWPVGDASLMVAGSAQAREAADRSPARRRAPRHRSARHRSARGRSGAGGGRVRDGAADAVGEGGLHAGVLGAPARPVGFPYDRRRRPVLARPRGAGAGRAGRGPDGPRHGGEPAARLPRVAGADGELPGRRHRTRGRRRPRYPDGGAAPPGRERPRRPALDRRRDPRCRCAGTSSTPGGG